jgi:hypothetical protein
MYKKSLICIGWENHIYNTNRGMNNFSYKYIKEVFGMGYYFKIPENVIKIHNISLFGCKPFKGIQMPKVSIFQLW